MTKIFRPQDVTFILVKPRYGGNIGAAARVLKNMGFAKFSLVRPSVLPTHPEALRLAVGAADLLGKAKIFDSVTEASKGLRFLIGTSRRTGKYRRDFVDLPEIASKLPVGQKVGILFGAEERGLTNEELGHCNLVVQIPSNPDFGSLNLAQSVAVVSYQLRINAGGFPNKAADGTSKEGGTEKKQIEGARRVTPAPITEIEGMYGHLTEVLEQIGFTHNGNSDHIMRSIRQMFARAQLTMREVRILRGMCRQISWATAKKASENQQ